MLEKINTVLMCKKLIRRVKVNKYYYGIRHKLSKAELHSLLCSCKSIKDEFLTKRDGMKISDKSMAEVNAMLTANDLIIDGLEPSLSKDFTETNCK